MYYEYDIYKRARNTAWQFLLDNKVNKLPISLSEICADKSIRLLRDSRHELLSDDDRGATYIKEGKYHIVINGLDPVSVQRYTTAHELGHIYLNHPMSYGLYGRTYGIQRKPKTSIEYQAERFAIDILAPACVLWGLDLYAPEDIADVCKISIQSAVYRSERMKLLRKRNSFLRHPLEREVYKQFKSFVENAQ